MPVSDPILIVILMGVAGSGKTTVGERLAAALGWTFADADAYHVPASIDKMHAGVPLTDADRAPWLARLSAEIARWLAESRRVVLACSALKESYRQRLFLEPARMRGVLLTAPKEVLAARLANRTGHFAPASLLGSQLATLEPPSPEDALVVDVSGTPDQAVAAIRRGLHL